MHLTTGLGIGLLGIASANSSPRVEPIAPASSEAPVVRFVSISPSTEIQVLEGARRFYNEDWNDFVELQGEWDEVQSAAGVVLRPLDDSCTLGVYSRLLDELHYLPVPAKGRVSFADGWIQVDQVGAWRREPMSMTTTLGAESGDCDSEFSGETVAHVTFEGDCWSPQGLDEGCENVEACLSQGAAGCGVEFLTHEAARARASYFESACGEHLVVSTCTNDQGVTTHCVDEP